MNFIRICLILCAALTLPACGGGGDSGEVFPDKTTQPVACGVDRVNCI